MERPIRHHGSVGRGCFRKFGTGEQVRYPQSNRAAARARAPKFATRPKSLAILVVLMATPQRWRRRRGDGTSASKHQETMIRQSSMYAWVAAGLLAAICERTASAQDVSGLEGLLSEQIVSTASKHAEGASSAPALSTNVSAEDLRRYGIRTVAEAVDFLGIAVGSSDNLSGGEVGARGVLLTGDKGSHFLLLVDGQTMNDPLRGGTTFGPGAGIPIELVDHIEIVVGPGSVLYGSNAMFGIVNVVTKRAKDYCGARVIVESTLPISVRVGAGAGAEFKLFGAPTELTTQIEYFKQEGPDLYFEPEDTGIDRFTGQPGRHTRSGPADGIW